jgi:hypothetical protein
MRIASSGDLTVDLVPQAVAGSGARDYDAGAELSAVLRRSGRRRPLVGPPSLPSGAAM